MKKVDITSDVHVDHWIDPSAPEKKQWKLITTFVKGLVSEDHSDTLVIAGDIGHYNWQNAIFFRVLREYYENVIWVHGNHDLYLVSKKIQKKFNFNSFNRLNDMIELSNNIDGVHYLDGDTIQIDDYIIAGAGMWYDNTYAKNEWGYSEVAIKRMWLDGMNDSNLITVPNTPDSIMDYLEYCKDQYEKLDAIIDGADMVVSHVAPCYQHTPSKYHEPFTTFYQFDGSDMLMRLSDSCVWLFGHTHDMYSYKHPMGVQIYCNPLGYPLYGMNAHNPETYAKRQFKTIELGEMPSYDEVFKDVL